MKFSVVAAALGLAGAALAGPCDNNCGRAVVGTNRKDPSLEDRQSACSSFVTRTTTVTPGTVTITQAPIYQRNLHNIRQAPIPVLTEPKPAYASACADVTAYWNACQCFEGNTATLVVITAATPTVTVAAPTCTQGLQFALYAPRPNTPQFDNLAAAQRRGVNGREVLDLQTQLQGVRPDATGVTAFFARVQGQSTSPVTVYNVTGPVNSTMAKTVLDHRGFIVPETAGNYTISVPDADDAILVWVYERAVSGFSKNNTVINEGYNEPGSVHVVTVSPAQVRVPIPIRILYVNWAGGASSNAIITDPTGKQILSRTSEKNRQLLAGCSGFQAPAPSWIPWESEVVGSNSTSTSTSTSASASTTTSASTTGSVPTASVSTTRTSTSTTATV